jgi:chromosome segregation ATPase
VSDATERAQALLARVDGDGDALHGHEPALRRALAEALAELSEAAKDDADLASLGKGTLVKLVLSMRKDHAALRAELSEARGELDDVKGLLAAGVAFVEETGALETACQEAMRKADDHRRQRDEARYACKAAEGSAEFLHEQLQAAQAEIAQLKQDLAETTAHAIDCEKSCEELVAEKAELQRSYEALHHEAAADARLAAADRAEHAQLKQPAHVLGEAERLLREREVFTVLLTDIVAPGAATRHETQLRARKSHRDTSASTLAEAYAALAGGRDV